MRNKRGRLYPSKQFPSVDPRTIDTPLIEFLKFDPTRDFAPGPEPGDPTPEEIERLKKEIQDSWEPWQERERSCSRRIDAVIERAWDGEIPPEFFDDDAANVL